MTERYKGYYREVRAESFRRCLPGMSDYATDCKGQILQGCVVLALFYAMRYTNDSRYLLEDENSRETQR